MLLDSLELINPKSLSKEDKAYYHLLHTILSDKSIRDFTSDSIIAISVDYYQKNEDDYNLLRSLVYQGIVRYRIDAKDTAAFLIMKIAETLSLRQNENDSMMFRINGLMYGTIGEMLFADRSYSTAEDYYSKAADSFEKSSDIINYCSNYLNIVWCNIVLMKYDIAKRLLDEIPINDYPLNVQSSIYNTYSELYHAMNDDLNSIIYRKKQMAVDKLLGRTVTINDLFSLSNTYLKVDVDSAQFYASMMLSLVDTSDHNLPQYYKLCSKILAATGMYDKAYDILLESWNVLFQNTYKSLDKKVTEIENKYNYSEMKRIAEKERNHKIIIIGLFATFFFIIILIGFFVHSKTKYINLKNDEIQIERDKLKAAYTVMINNVAIIPDMVKKTDALSSKYVSQIDLSKEISSLSNLFRSNYKTRLSELSAVLAKSHSSVPVDALSDKESIIYFLSKDGYSSYEIAKMMCISDSNVRATLKMVMNKLSIDKR